MVKPGDVLEAAPLGVRLEIRRTAADTGGELVEFDVVGRARGFITQPHKHAKQAERHEVIEGAMRLVIDGREHLLGPGDAIEVPRGATHRQVPAGAGAGHVRVQLRPAANSEAFLERLADIAGDGQYNRWGYPKPRAAARLLADFRDEGRPALPTLRRRDAGAPTAGCCACSPRSCGPPSAGPTTGRSRAGSRASSRSCSVLPDDEQALRRVVRELHRHAAEHEPPQPGVAAR